MFRSYLLSVFLLCAYATLAHGMAPQNRELGFVEEYGPMGIFGFDVPKATVMTMATALFQAMMYDVPYKDMLVYALFTGGIACFGGMFLGLPSFCIGGLLGIDPRNYPYNIVSAAAFTAIILNMNKHLLLWMAARSSI